MNLHRHQKHSDKEVGCWGTWNCQNWLNIGDFRSVHLNVDCGSLDERARSISLTILYENPNPFLFFSSFSYYVTFVGLP